jgi:hypothetical protein
MDTDGKMVSLVTGGTLRVQTGYRPELAFKMYQGIINSKVVHSRWYLLVEQRISTR